MDEMDFAELKMLLDQWPYGDKGVMGEFRAYVRGGCTEEEAKIWLGQHIWEFDDNTREKLTMLFAADSLNQAAKKASTGTTPPETKSRVWTTCKKYRNVIKADLWNRLMSGNEEQARNFLTEHIKEFPQQMQDELIMVFFEEGVAAKLDADRQKLERLRKIRDTLR